MLISQANLIDNRLGWALTIAGGLAVALRLAAIKRWYPQFNLPRGAIALGAVLLLANVALPRIFRSVIAVDYYNWHVPNLIAWYFALPIVAAAANLLPRPSRYGGLNPERHWLPIFIYALWAGGTGVHIWSVGHIAARPFEMVFLAPAVWAAAWTVRNRLTDFVAVPSLALQRATMIIAGLTPLVALGHPKLFTGLALANALIFGVLAFRQAPDLARELALVSLLAAVAAMPIQWNFSVLTTRAEHAAMALAVYAIITGVRSSRAAAGILGALGAGLAMTLLARAWSVHAGVQVALVFLVIHSLRWPEQRAHATIRCVAASFWVVDAFVWTRQGSFGESWYVAAGAVLACLAATLCVLRQTRRVPPSIPVSSAATALSGPTNWFVAHSSVGLTALLASFLFFALGAILALTRHKWSAPLNEVESKPE